MSKYKLITNRQITKLNRDGGKTFFQPHHSDKFDNVVNTFSKRLDQLLNIQNKEKKNIYEKEKKTIKEKYIFNKEQISKGVQSNYVILDEKRKEEEQKIKKLRKQKHEIVSFLKKSYIENPLASKVIVIRKLEQSAIKYNQVGINNIDKYDMNAISKEFEEEKKKIFESFDFDKIDSEIKNSNTGENIYKKISTLTKTNINKFVEQYEDYIKDETLQFLQKSLKPNNNSRNLIASIIYNNIQLTKKIVNKTLEKKFEKNRSNRFSSLTKSLSSNSSSIKSSTQSIPQSTTQSISQSTTQSITQSTGKR